MSLSAIASVDASLHTVEAWLADLKRELETEDDRYAFQALRAVLHVVRDRLPVDEAAHLAAQLPMLVRGLYYEGWRPARTPLRLRHQEQLLARVQQEFGRGGDPATVVRCVMRTLARRLDPGIVDHVRHLFPRELRRLWPDERPPTGADA